MSYLFLYVITNYKKPGFLTHHVDLFKHEAHLTWNQNY